MRYFLASVLSLAVVLGACSKARESGAEGEVRVALSQYLQKKGNLSLNNMTMDIQSVKINGDSAEAQVHFQSNEKPDLAVAIHYVLRRAGGHWEVESSSPAGGMGADPHQSAGAAGGVGGGEPMAPPASPAPGEPKPQPSH